MYTKKCLFFAAILSAGNAHPQQDEPTSLKCDVTHKEGSRNGMKDTIIIKIYLRSRKVSHLGRIYDEQGTTRTIGEMETKDKILGWSDAEITWGREVWLNRLLKYLRSAAVTQPTARTI